MGSPLELLLSKNIEVKERGKDLLIHCLNPDHEDQHPSLRVDRETGIFNCFGCGFKGDVYQYFNRSGPRLTQSMRRVLKAIDKAKIYTNTSIGFPNEAYFEVADFKGIPAELLKKYKAFVTSEHGLEDRLCLPIFDNSGNIRAYLGRHMHSNASPKYMMYPKEVKLPLYPTIRQLGGIGDTLIIVEGLFDALTLISKGIPNVTCAFGTKSLNADNIAEKLNPFVCAGVERIVLLMDGDNAGIAAANKISKAIEYKTDLIVEVIPLPEGEDPGSLDDEHIELLKNNLNSL